MLKDRLYGNDAEGFQFDGTTLDAEQLHQMASDDKDREEMEMEITTDVAAADEASQTVVEVQEAVEVLAAGVEEMNPVEVGKAIGAIEDKLDTIAENVEEVVADTEALVAGNLVAGVRQELEAISDKIKSAWEAVKNFFRAVWAKIKQMMLSVVLWATNAFKKSEDIISKLNAKGNKVKEDVDEASIIAKVGSKLVAMNALGFTVADVKEWSGKVLDSTSKSKIDSSASSTLTSGRDFKVGVNITSAHTVKVTRFAGSSVSFGLGLDVDGKVAYDGYSTANATPAVVSATQAKIGKALFSDGKGYAKGLLSKSKELASIMKVLKEKLYAEMNTVGGIVEGNVESVKFDQGIFKMVWSKTLGSKSTEQLTAEDKVKLIRNRSSFTSNAAKDVLFGLNAFMSDINGIGSIAIGMYEDKK